MNWKQCEVIEPPFTRHLSDEDLSACIEESSPLLAPICNHPCHTQEMKRIMKTVTEASSKISGSSASDGSVRVRFVDRKSMPGIIDK
ncbi:hypothetical protein AVEN_150013-1 [Araneus ventricosus]|uniref:Uncharacterized protein n=1 Tax=Araneus ventricosus TaxID=182803 RepID=A0A4Y2HRX3_ARAVE|nr:hypothetical protein AVEN_150013-1 [Araneus ventricosus]